MLRRQVVEQEILSSSSSSLLFKCALRESGCRIGYEPMKDELRSLSAVDIQGHQRGGFCIVPRDHVERRRLRKIVYCSSYDSISSVLLPRSLNSTAKHLAIESASKRIAHASMECKGICLLR